MKEAEAEDVRGRGEGWPLVYVEATWMFGLVAVFELLGSRGIFSGETIFGFELFWLFGLFELFELLGFLRGIFIGEGGIWSGGGGIWCVEERGGGKEDWVVAVVGYGCGCLPTSMSPET